MRNVLALLLFLSSCGTAAAMPTETKYVEAIRKLDGRGGCGSGGIVGAFCLPFIIPSATTFESGASPVRYLFKWPRIPTTAEQLIFEARERLKPLVYEKPRTKHPWRALWILVIAGVGLLIAQTAIIDFERRM